MDEDGLTERRVHPRRLGAVAAALAVVVVGGLVTVRVLSTGGPTTGSTTASSTAASSNGTAAPAVDERAAGDSCAVPDQQLFAQLGELLPAVRGATPRPLDDHTYCPDGGRGVEVEVADGADGARGTLRVLLSPPSSVGGGSSIQTGGGSMSTSTVSVRGGGSLSLSTQSSEGDDEGGAPYEDDLDDLADELADRNAH